MGWSAVESMVHAGRVTCKAHHIGCIRYVKHGKCLHDSSMPRAPFVLLRGFDETEDTRMAHNTLGLKCQPYVSAEASMFSSTMNATEAPIMHAGPARPTVLFRATDKSDVLRFVAAPSQNLSLQSRLFHSRRIPRIRISKGVATNSTLCRHLIRPVAQQCIEKHSQFY